MSVLLLGASLLQAPSGPAGSPGQGEDHDRIVSRLGSPDPEERQAAERELQALGAKAEGALRRHRASPDVETRQAVERLILRLEWNRNPPLVFQGGKDPPNHLYRLDPRGGEPQALFEPVTGAFSPPLWKARWAPGASGVSYYVAGWGVFWWDSRTGEVRTWSTIPMESSGECAWSPSGDALAFISSGVPDGGGGYRRGTFEQIHVLKPLSGETVAVTKGPISHSDPCWSGDGKRLVYVAHDSRSRRTDLFIVAAAGGAPEALTSDGSHKEGPQRSPKEDRIAFAWIQEEEAVLALLEPGKKGARRITSKGRREGMARWSPDGNWIAFASARGESDDRDLFLIDREGQNERRLTRGAGDKSHPTWSPDGRRIAFQNEREGHPEIFVVDVDGSGMKQLTKTEHGAREPIWAPFR